MSACKGRGEDIKQKWLVLENMGGIERDSEDIRIAVEERLKLERRREWFKKGPCKICGKYVDDYRPFFIKGIGTVCYNCYLRELEKKEKRVKDRALLKKQIKEKANKIGFSLFRYTLVTLMALGYIIFLGLQLYAIYCDIVNPDFESFLSEPRMKP